MGEFYALVQQLASWCSVGSEKQNNHSFFYDVPPCTPVNWQYNWESSLWCTNLILHMWPKMLCIMHYVAHFPASQLGSGQNPMQNEIYALWCYALWANQLYHVCGTILKQINGDQTASARVADDLALFVSGRSKWLWCSQPTLQWLSIWYYLFLAGCKGNSESCQEWTRVYWINDPIHQEIGELQIFPGGVDNRQAGHESLIMVYLAI